MVLVGSLDVAVSGDEVEFTFEVRNDGDDPVEVTFPNACTVDVAVFEDDAEVWRWSEGRMFAQMIQQETFNLGDGMTETRVWESAPAGDYEAVATLEARGQDLEAGATFSV
ncbi:hypothetical protein BRC81_14210 [Halobacteriales archaeon QS_1_68_20]|nr:MAG: hypothetical protein BRC81_14210 [Halobacteriales archaeon QS_1_68_20]